MRLAMPDAVKRFFAPVPESVGQARDFALHTLAAWDLEGRADDVRLCVSELATNALTHSTRCGQGFHVTMSAEDDIVRIEVHDASPTAPAPSPHQTTTSPAAACTSSTCSATTGASKSSGVAGKVVWSRFKTAPATQGAPC